MLTTIGQVLVPSDLTISATDRRIFLIAYHILQLSHRVELVNLQAVDSMSYQTNITIKLLQQRCLRELDTV